MKAGLPHIILKPKRDSSLRRFHPWVFSGAIERVEGEASEGDVVEVYSASGDYLATGHYASSSISVKVLSFRKTAIDDSFWESRVSRAYDVRKTLRLVDCEGTDSYRLINAEGDFLPGLIADAYADAVVLQCHSLGMFRAKEQIAAALCKALGEKLATIYCKSADTLGHESAADLWLRGDASSTVVREGGYKFSVDWRNGQKTGFFIDQRENRALLARYCQGRKVLNAFSYTGGFSIYALGAGAREVHSLDTSQPALRILQQNLDLNFKDAAHKSISEDCFDYLAQTSEQYEVMVVDPPPFAKQRSALEQGLNGYRAINYHAMKRLKAGGILFTFSCSQAVQPEPFRQAINQAAAQAGRRAVILQELRQAQCHVVDLAHPEGEYLKGLILRIE